MLVGHKPKDFLLAVEALTVSFDGFKAVNDLSLYVEENEIRVIIGPNGAGKTTVLDLICGKTKATSGSIQFRGQELTKMKENQIVQTGVGRKFQTPSIYDDLTVFENLEISFPRVGSAAHGISGGGFRVMFDGLIAIGDGLVVVALIEVGGAAVAIGQGKIGLDAIGLEGPGDTGGLFEAAGA